MVRACPNSYRIRELTFGVGLIKSGGIVCVGHKYRTL